MVPATRDLEKNASAVRRFTTRFDPEQDRIKLLIEHAAGDVKVAWMTRRLLNRVVSALLDRLRNAPTLAAADEPRAAIAAQRFTQAAAVSEITPQKAVTVPEGDAQPHEEVLITRVDIQYGREDLLLVLREGSELVLSLPFSEQGLRQWLDVVYVQYQQGEWSEPFWPDWMKRPNSAEVSVTRVN
jgi:hypothetical protein